MKYRIAIHNIEEAPGTYRVFTVNNPNVILIHFLEEKRTNGYTLLFHRYYKNSHITSFDHVFPFIMKNGKYEWHVPIEEVTIGDFANTHNIGENDTIYIEEGGVGGWGDSLYISEIITWASVVLECFGNVLTLAALAKFVEPIYKKLIGKDGKVASVNEMADKLTIRKEWTKKELEKEIPKLDLIIMEKILIEQGFAKEGDRYIASEENIVDEVKEETLEDYELIRDEISYEKAEIKRRTNDLNNLLLSLYLQSDHYNTCDYDVIIKIINKFIHESRGFFRRGEGPVIIEFNEDYYEERDFNQLCYELDNLCKYTSLLCESIDEESGKESR